MQSTDLNIEFACGDVPDSLELIAKLMRLDEVKVSHLVVATNHLVAIRKLIYSGELNADNTGATIQVLSWLTPNPLSVQDKVEVHSFLSKHDVSNDDITKFILEKQETTNL